MSEEYYDDSERQEGELFNFDDDPSEPTESETEQLTWRLEPSKSLSDWTMKVVNRETRQSEYYYVHKNIMAVGSRCSQYFIRHFRNTGGLAVNTDDTTEVHLEQVAATCVPQMLDFMYSTEGKIEIDTESAVGLRHLAQFFGIKAMHKKVMDFILGDLSMKNVLIYYQDSVVLDDDKIMELAATHCAKHVLEIERSSELLRTVDPHFFRRIMASPEINSEEKHYHISLILSEYCIINREYLDEQDFVRLTDETYLPHVHHQAALILMEMEADLVISTVPDGASEITSLQNRCVKDLTLHWEDMSDMDQNNVMRVFRKLSSNVLADLLVQSMSQAKRRVNRSSEAALQAVKQAKEAERMAQEAEDELEKTRTLVEESKHEDKKQASEVSKVKKQYEARLTALRTKHKEDIEAMKKEFEVNLVKLRDVCVDKDKHITKYWNELKKFERLPNQPSGKVMPSGMLNKATCMPEIGKHAADGFVLINKKSGSKLPLFYYTGEAD